MTEGSKRWGLTYEQANNAKPLGRIQKLHGVPAAAIHVEDGDEMVEEPGKVYHENVVNTLRVQVASLHGFIEGLTEALNVRTQELAEARNRTHTEAGWFLPKDKLTDGAAESLNHLIKKAKQVSVVNVVVSPGQPYQIDYEADWVKYLLAVEPAAIKDDQTWIVKLGSAVAHLHEPSLVNRVSASKQEETIKRLMADLGSPNSNTLAQAFKQFANEICTGHVSLESVVQQAAGTHKAPAQSSEPSQEVQESLKALMVFANIIAHLKKSIGEDPAEGRDRFEQVLDELLSQYVPPSVMKDTTLVEDVRAAFKAHYLKCFDEQAVAVCAGEGGCVSQDKPSACCTRNRPLDQQDCKHLRKVVINGIPLNSTEFTCAECPHQAVLEGCCGRNTLVYGPGYVNAAPLTTELGVKDDSKSIKATITYARDALLSPTNVQKAVVMGLVGTDAQKAEARDFLTQHLAVEK